MEREILPWYTTRNAPKTAKLLSIVKLDTVW
jgi:hypothetical protein